MFRKLAEKLRVMKNRSWLDDQDFEGVRCLMCRTVFDGTAEEAVTAFLEHPCKKDLN